MKFKHPPLDHQMSELKTSSDLKARALFWEMGTGKSKVVIDTMAWLYLQGKIDTVIVVAKKGEYTNWKHVEIPEHMSPDVAEYVVEAYRSGMREHEKQRIRELVKPGPRLRVLCINVESMLHEGGQVARAFAKSQRRGMMLVVDESTCVKNHKSARSKKVYELAALASHRRVLSGTPVPRAPLDIWGQSLVLGKGVLGPTTFTAFKGEYAVEEVKQFGARAFKQITGYKNVDRLQARIKSVGSILERADCVDLPPKIYKKMVAPMTDRQESLYAEMRDLALVELGDGEIVEATNTLGVLSRLDQIACGQIKLEDGTFEILPSVRPEMILEAVTTSSAKGIIWCNYRGLLEHLYETLLREIGPEDVGRYYGGVSDQEREFTLLEFQNGSRKRWIVANQQSLGYGRTLTAGTENYYYSNGYNLEHRLQSEDRTMRIGQRFSVLYGDLFSPGTVNEKILDNLRGKKVMSTQVLGTRLRDWI